MTKLYVAFIVCAFAGAITERSQSAYKPHYFCTFVSLADAFLPQSVATPTPTPTPTATPTPTPTPAATPATLLSAASRRTHGGAGTFDVALPLTGTPGIECREGSSFQVIATFTGPVTVSAASVTMGIGSVSSFSVSGSQVTVILTGVSNAQTIATTLSTNQGCFSIPMSVLTADTNANGAVNAADIAQTKSRVGQTVDATNFRSDQNGNGTINAADVAIVKLLSGTALPLYVGVDPVAPDISTQTADPSGTSINLTEGNLIESQPIGGTNCPSCAKCSDGQAASIDTHCISFTLTYNSRDAGGPCPAAGSRPALYSVMGSGWTHSFNIFLFSQGGDDIFRFDDIGRVTKYTHNPDNTYTADPGRFETLVRQSSSTFVLTQKDHTQFTFVGGPIYRLMQIRDRNNDTMTLSYSGGNLMSVTDTYGRSMSFSYDGNQHVASATDPLLRTTTFTYDPTGSQLITITDPRGQMISYTYNSRNQLTSKLDKDGRLYSYTYTNNQPTASNSSDGSNFTLTYMPSFTIKVDGRGNQWRYDYDSNAYLTRMTAPDGAITTYTYDAATRRLQSVTDANNHTTQYQYDSQGNRTRITLSAPFNYVSMFTYEPMFNMMTTMTDPKGRVTAYSYDSQGNRTMETDPLLQTRQWTYDAHGNVLTETDKRGNTTAYGYDAAGNRNMIMAPSPLGYVTTMTYDGVGNLIARTDPNSHTTTYQYDELNRLIKQTDPAGHFDQYVYDNQGNRVQEIDRNNHSTFFQYDQRGRLIKTTDALSHFETYGYDANNNRTSMTDRNGHSTTYQYDVQNRLSMTTDAGGNVTSMAYDAVGNMISMTDANLHTTSYAYDALNRRTTVTNSLGYVTMFEYDMGGSPGCGTCGATPGTSLITKQTDGNGKVTYFRYDELDRQTKIIRKEGDVDPDPDPSDAVTSYTYDPNNNRLTMTEPDTNTTTYQYDVLNRRTRETNAAGDVTQFTYDGADNLITITAPNLNVTTNTYDVVDRLTQVDDSVGRVVSYSYDFVGNRLTQANGNNNITSYSYDAINRLIATTDPLTQSTTTLYDPVGNVLNVTDREGNMTMHGYDNINRQLSTTDALNHTTQFQYDGVGNLTSITDANGHATQYQYDNINRRITETYPDSPPNTRTFIYDAVNMISRTDQRGQTTNYMYNDLYFLLHRTYPVSPADNMTYDLSGRMLTAERGGWVVTFAYDGGNRVTQTQQNAKTIGYVYNIPGRTRMITYPGGRQLTEATDARTRLDHIDDGTSPPIVQYSYDLGNRVGTRNYRNGTVATYTYNANDWTTSLEHMFGATRIAGFGYDFDHEGNKKFEEKRHDTSHSESYQYDDVYRLVNYKVAPLPSPTPIITQTAYNLDAVGNWTSKTTDGVTQMRMHNAANELTMIDATNLLYDDNGNLQNDSTYTFAYDEENRLTQVTRNSDNAVVGQYQYDALGRRVKKIANPAGTPIETRYFYDDARIIEEQSSIGTTLATYVYGNYIDEVLSMDRGGQTVFYHQNSLWSLEAITNTTGAPIERYSYDAYGQPSVFDGSGSPIPPNPWGTPHSAIGNSYTFTGRQLDEEAGLYFYRARFYDPMKGRFFQRDPGGYVDGTNLYEYVRGRPTFGVDPTGLACALAAATCEVTSIDVSSDDGVAKPQQDETKFSLRWFIAIEGKNLKLCESAQFNTIVVSLWNEKGTALKKEEVLKAYESSNIQSEPQTHPFAENAKDQGDEFGFGKGEAWGQFKSDKTKVTLDRHLQYIPYYRDSEEEKKYYAYKNKGDFVLKVRDKKTKDIVKEHKWGYEYRNYKGDAPKAPVESEKDAGIYSHYGISGKVPFDKGG